MSTQDEIDQTIEDVQSAINKLRSLRARQLMQEAERPSLRRFEVLTHNCVGTPDDDPPSKAA